MNPERIKLCIEGEELFAFYAIAFEFKKCGKASSVGLIPNATAKQNFKFNEADFMCVYHSIIQVMNSDRYSTKNGNEYLALYRLKSYFEAEYSIQKGCDIEGSE